MSNESRTLYVTQRGEAVKWEVPVQEIGPSQVQIQVKAVAVNPIDAQQVKASIAEGCGIGCDFSGIVTKIGTKVKSVKPGDTVAGGVGGCNVDAKMDGSFSELIRVEESHLFKLPQTLESDPNNAISAGPIRSFEQAASLGISLGTAVLLFAWNNHTPVRQRTQSGYVVVYGAATMLGYMVLQVAKYLGYDCIAVASKCNEQLLKNVGAKIVIDYHDPDWQEQVLVAGGDNIVVACDCYSAPETVSRVYSLITSTGRSYVNYSVPSITPQIEITTPKPNVRLTAPNWFHLCQDVKKFGLQSLPADPTFIECRVEIYDQINQLLLGNHIIAPPISVIGDGLESVPDALDHISKGVHATKLVIRL